MNTPQIPKDISDRLEHMRPQWCLETFLLGIFGAALIYVGLIANPELSIIEEAIILVIFLGALLGVAPIPFPNLRGKIWLYPIIAGLLSALMDSFLVLLLVAALPIHGSYIAKMTFKVYVMIAALIGGLLIYFGEVYALPHYLKYGMSQVYDGLPLLVPVMIFLGVLGYLAQRLKIKIDSHSSTLAEGIEIVEHTDLRNDYQSKQPKQNLVEFFVGIGIIFFTHNAILALGILFLYSFISGQGKSLIEVVRSETEMSVIILLSTTWVLAPVLTPLLHDFSNSGIFGLSVISAVVAGALLPAGGDVWMEISLISAGALVLPISSLVGVMLFKTMRQWIIYVKIAIPLTILWLVLSIGWFAYIWPNLEPKFFEVFDREPYTIVTEKP